MDIRLKWTVWRNKLLTWLLNFTKGDFARDFYCLFVTFFLCLLSLNAWRNCTKDQALLISEGVIYFLSLQTSNFLFKCKQQSLPLLLIIYLSIYFLSLFSCDVRDSAMASITERAQRMEKDLRETNAKNDRAAAELQVRRENMYTYGVLVCGCCACAERDTCSGTHKQSARRA